MTCIDMREHLLTGSSTSFDNLLDHTRTCSDCAALADRIRRAEIEIDHHLEQFMTAIPFDDSWQSAIGTHGPTQTFEGPTWLHGSVLLVAATAVLGLALFAGGGPPPPQENPNPQVNMSASPLLLAAEELARRFEEWPTSGVDMVGLGRAAEDEKIRGMLSAKAEALSTLEAELTIAIDSGDSEVAIDAMEMLADAYLHMGESIRYFQPPTYLNDEQNEVYVMALEGKAYAQDTQALEAFQLAVGKATGLGLAARADALNARVASLLAAREAADAATKKRPSQKEVPARAIRKATDTLRALREDCAAELDAGSYEEIGLIIEQAEMVVKAGESAMYPDILELLGTYTKAVRQACEG